MKPLAAVLAALAIAVLAFITRAPGQLHTIEPADTLNAGRVKMNSNALTLSNMITAAATGSNPTWTNLPTTNAVSGTNLLIVVTAPGQTNGTRQITINNFRTSLAIPDAGTNCVVNNDTNIILVTGAGTAAANGRYVWRPGGGGSYTNTAGTHHITNSAGERQIRAGASTLYISYDPPPFNLFEDVISGMAPSPTGAFGLSTNCFSSETIANLSITGAVTNQGNVWSVFIGNGRVYHAENRTAGVLLRNVDFAALCQEVVDQAGDGGFIHIAGNPIANAVYWVSNTITIMSTIVISGDGNPTTILRMAPSLNGPIFSVGTAGTPTTGINRFTRIRFEGGEGGAAGVGIHFVNSPEPVLFECEWTQFKFAALRFSQVNFNHWSYAQNCWFVMLNGGIGILFDRQPAQTDQLDFYVHDCMFGIGQGRGIVVSNLMLNVSIQGCRFRWFAPYDTSIQGIQLYAGGNYSIIGNRFLDWPTNSSPIRFEDRASATNYNSTVIGNHVSMVGALGANSATNVVYVGANVQGVSLAGNYSPDGTGYVLGGNNAPPLIVDRNRIFAGINTPRGPSPGGLLDAALSSTYTNNASFSTNLVVTNLLIEMPLRVWLRPAVGAAVSFPQFTTNDWTHDTLGVLPRIPTNGRPTLIEIIRFATRTNLAWIGR